jgi:MOSC domain-containing protein YiiM
MSTKITDSERTIRSKGTVVAVNISQTKGSQKQNVGKAQILKGFGIQDDAHGGQWHRQVSLLARESIEKIRELGVDAGCGDFAENITTSGLDLVNLPVGTHLQIGPSAILEVTQIGKECHTRCSIYYQAGTCVMPEEGIFARVLSGGPIQAGDIIEVIQTRPKAFPKATTQGIRKH